jgi:uncharacterized protein (TIGR02444 family)
MSPDPLATHGGTCAGEDELWTFSVSLYGHRLVRRYCLALQDASGADVNIILLLLYAATRGIALTADHVSQLDRCCAQWRETVIRPLREARRAAKSAKLPGSTDVYSMLKSGEIASERVGQRILGRELQQLSQPTDARTPLQLGRANLLAYRDVVPMADAAIDDLLEAFSDFVRGPTTCT